MDSILSSTLRQNSYCPFKLIGALMPSTYAVAYHSSEERLAVPAYIRPIGLKTQGVTIQTEISEGSFPGCTWQSSKSRDPFFYAQHGG